MRAVPHAPRPHNFSFPSLSTAQKQFQIDTSVPGSKNLPAMWETRVQSLGREDPLEKGMATRSSILAWRIPWTGSLVGYSPWGHKESNMTE